MPRKTRKRVKPKRRGNSIKFKHRLVRGGSIPRKITKKVSPSHTPKNARYYSKQAAEGIKKYEKKLGTRGSTTQASSALMKLSEGQSRSRNTIMENLQTRKRGGRKTRKKGNKSMKRRC